MGESHSEDEITWDPRTRAWVLSWKPMRPISPVEGICWDNASCGWRLSWRDAARKRHYKKFTVDHYGSVAAAWDAATSALCMLIERGEVSFAEPQPTRPAATGLGVRFKKDNRSKPYMVQLVDPVTKKRVCHGHFADQQAAEDKARQVLQQQAAGGSGPGLAAALQEQDGEPEVTLQSQHVGVSWREKEDSYYAEVRQQGTRRTRRFKANDDKLAAKRLAVQWRRAEKQAMTKRKGARPPSLHRATPSSGGQRKRAARPEKA